MYSSLLFFLFIGTCFSDENPIFGNVYGNTKNIGTKIPLFIRKPIDYNRILVVSNKSIHATTDHNFRKQFTRSKLARGSAISKKCNSRCSAKIPCNKRCQLARDRYQLELAKKKYKKDNVKKYTSTQLNQRYYSGQVSSGKCNSRCKSAKEKYQKQRTQYMKTFHIPCQNGHITNTGYYNGKPLSNQGNPNGNTPGDKTTIGTYGGVAKGRPLGAPGAAQINWPNSAKYNWRTACKSYSSIIGSTKPPSKNYYLQLYFFI
jgi:hypothetical protein